jgi:hypothetical protein
MSELAKKLKEVYESEGLSVEDIGILYMNQKSIAGTTINPIDYVIDYYGRAFPYRMHWIKRRRLGKRRYKRILDKVNTVVRRIPDWKLALDESRYIVERGSVSPEVTFKKDGKLCRTRWR